MYTKDMPRTETRHSLLFLLALYGVIFFFFVSTAEAQISIGGEGGAGIKLEPVFPEPLGTVTASLDAYSLDTSGATISWFANGTELTEFKNARSITLPTGRLGQKTSLAVTVKPPAVPGFTLRKDIVPSMIDVVVEASTYVPSFYRGRALPSGDSEVRVVVIPLLGSNEDPSSLSYVWEQNGSVLFGGPVRGKQSASLTVSRYTGGYIEVRVLNARGEQVGQRIISLESTAPELHFYEENPLRGLSEMSIKENLALIGEETTVHGEAYFMNINPRFDTDAFEWTIDGAPTRGGEDPHTITLRKTGGGGSATIGLQAVRRNGIPEFVRGNFMINF